MERETRNAKITGTMLGLEGHGLMSYFLYLDYGGAAGQGAGGFCLGGPKFGAEYLQMILETVGVETWEKLPGAHCRADADMGKVYRIGHILEDRWMDLSEGVGARTR